MASSNSRKVRENLTKRKRNSSVFHTWDSSGEATLIVDEQIDMYGKSITDLPIPILTHILLKLPIKEIVFCKSTCKIFYRLISSAAFAKLHFHLSQPCTLIRATGYPHISRTLYMVQLPDICNRKLGCHFPEVSDSNTLEKIKVDRKLKIPLRNAEIVLNNNGTDYGVCAKRKRCIKVKPSDHKLNIVNSCNGLICLSEPSLNNPVIVCNPVTGEFINLPEEKTTTMDTKFTHKIDCGFGFDPVTNEFKVIRMFWTDQGTEERISCPLTGEMHYCHSVTEILSLGSGSWKNIGYAPSAVDLRSPTYLKGSLHWLLYYFSKVHHKFRIASFNFSTELYQSISLPNNIPELRCGGPQTDRLSLCTLQGCLCVCDTSSCESLDIWVMKECGVKKSWIHKFSIHLLSEDSCLPFGLYQPLHLLANGAVLLFHPRKNALIYHDKKEHFTKYFTIQGFKSKFETIAHVPSFMSLKAALKGKTVPVLNVNARCAKYKLFGETKSVFLEDDFCTCPGSSSDYESDCSD